MDELDLSSDGLRYAVLWHTGVAEPHFDFLLETRPGSELATWRSLVWPIDGPTPVVRLKAHRRVYLDHEGEIGQHRGRVERVAGGRCVVEVGEDQVWSVRSTSGGSPLRLTLRAISGGAWEASPAT